MYGFFFVCDNYLGTCPHNLKKLLKNPGISKNWLTIGDCEPIDDNSFRFCGPQEASDHILSIIGCSFSNDTESQVKSHKTSKFQKVIFHGWSYNK